MNPFHKVNQMGTVGSICFATTFAFIWMIGLTFILSVILAMTDLKEDLPAYTFGIHAMSILAGGMMGGKKIGRKGWYYGGLCGLVYSISIIFIAFLAYDAGFSLYALMLIVLATVAGMLGGMIGVNLKR